MDPDSLVNEQFEDGRKLIEALRNDGFPVSAAGWIQESDGGQWYLYIVSPEVDTKGPKAAYHALNATYRRIGPLWVGPFEIKMVGTEEPVAKALEDFHRRYPGKFPARLPGSQFVGLPIDQAFVYASLATP
jgi:hypothetical protein